MSSRHGTWDDPPSLREESPSNGERRRFRAVIGSVGGVAITLDWSLGIIAVLVAAQLGLGVLPAWHPDWSPLLTWSVAIIAAFLFFASILVHELSHALVGRALGVPVDRITLFMFGGVAHLGREPTSARAELLMAAVGPAVSLAIGFGATIAGVLIAGEALSQLADDPARAYAALGPLATLLLWLGPVNVILALFNMVPGFPLDGGRVLRAAIWWATGSYERATWWATNAGRVVGLGLIAWGVVQMLGGAFAAGLWIALIGWIVRSAAIASYRQVVITGALSGVPVSAVMRRSMATVPASLSIESFVDDYVVPTEQETFPVLDEAGRVAGTVGASDVRRAPRSSWASEPVSRIMIARERLDAVEPALPASEALSRLAASEGTKELLVFDRGALVGLLRQNDLLRWVALRQHHA